MNQEHTKWKMNKNECVQYERRSLYLALTIPMVVLYTAVAVFLWQINVVFFAVYASLFVFVALFMSYVCVYWQCPYIGKFAPCVGGFCLPSSQIARLMKNAKRSEARYNAFLTLACLSFFGIILFPMYFLYVQDIVYLLWYIGTVVGYGLMFTLFICPACATKYVCPGGQAAVKMRAAIDSWHSRLRRAAEDE
jgi:FtsH-binding integral membrane protein